MKQEKLIPLKITTEYSLLKSLIKLPDLISFLVQNNITSCAICDDNLNGFMEFYLKCKENSIKPIIGLDVVINNLHVYLYAKNYLGYQKLLQIDYMKNNLEIKSIIDPNVLIILPYASIDLFEHLPKENVYIGYSKLSEKTGSLLLTENALYVNNIRCLYEKDLVNLKYLKLLNNEFFYNENSFYKNGDNEEIKNVQDFVSKINLEIPFDMKHIPSFEGKDFSYLKKLSFLGLKKRLGNINDIYLNRLNYELDIINKMGFVSYFLIVYDYVLYAKKNDIMVGPGRGSAAGSLVSYCLGITNIDPIKYNLLFERFLNINRKKMPDIDIDFEASKRFLMIEYVKNKYGASKVAVGLTFNNYKAKLILRDLSKVLNINKDLFEKFIKNIDSNKSLKENILNEKVKKYLDIYPDLNNLYKVAISFEGLKKNTSTHAAGVIISDDKIGKYIPISNDNGTLKTGIEMSYLEKMGFLKMDFLALEKLSIISGVSKKIPNFDINKISYDDKKTLEIFTNADTDDIFQFESSYAKQVLKKIKISSFNELIIALALVRPGANSQIEEYQKNKESNITIKDENLRKILSETYGTIIYQEQVMKIFEVIGGFSLFEADDIRSAISKKNEKLINASYEKFISGAKKNGYNIDFANNLFMKVKKFGSFGFNKSHSVAYAILAYQMAFLKANYPVEFTLYFLENNKDVSKISEYYAFLKQKGYKLLKPNINVSGINYIIKNNYVLLPFTSIKGLNNEIISNIINARKNGFKDIYDFIIKTNSFINEDIYKILVYSSLLEDFKINKKTLILNYEVLYNYCVLNDISLPKPVITYYDEYDNNTLYDFELTSYGIYITNHPCSKYKNVIKVIDIEKYLFKNIDMILLVTKVKVIKDKKGMDMAFICAEDETGKIELTVFSSIFEKNKNIKEKDIILFNVKVSKRFDKISVLVNNIKRK